MVATPARSPLTVLLAVDGSSYSDTEATLVAGIAWPAGTAVRVLAVVRGRLLFEHIRSVIRADVNLVERTYCLQVVFNELLVRNRQWRVIAGELRRAVFLRVRGR